MTTFADPITRVLLPTLRRVLQQALHEIDLGARHAAGAGQSEEGLWRARLAPDMLCLAHQVQVLADGVQGTVAHLRGDSGHPAGGRVFNRGEAQLPPPVATATAADALLRGARDAVDALAAAGPAAWQAFAASPVTVARPGDTRRFERDAFLWDYVLPNALFHATMIHALLRHAGVPLGKADFMGPNP